MAERAAVRTAAVRLRGWGWEFNSSNARPCVLIRCGIKITGGWLVLKLKCLSSLSYSRYPHLIIILGDHIEYPWPFSDYIFFIRNIQKWTFFSVFRSQLNIIMIIFIFCKLSKCTSPLFFCIVLIIHVFYHVFCKSSTKQQAALQGYKHFTYSFYYNGVQIKA